MFAKFLPIAMVIVILPALINLTLFLFKELFSETFIFFSSTLIEVFVIIFEYIDCFGDFGGCYRIF